MRRVCMVLLVGCAADAEPVDQDAWDFTADATGKADGASACAVTAPPAALGLDPFYAKYCSADGVPVVASSAVPDAALQHATRMISAMLAPIPHVRDAIVANHTRFGIIGLHQQTTDMPEYASWDPASNQRGKGWGAAPGQPLTSAAEENILCYEQDRWYGESILVHEFGHTIKQMGLEFADPTFKSRVQSAFDAAMAAHKYTGLYASTNPEEYWAEGVQDYFDVHRNTDSSDINTSAQLKSYDPALWAIIDGVFHDVRLPAWCPTPAFSTTKWYRIGNVAAGTVLDDSDLNPSGNYSGQYWKLSAVGGGYFRLTNKYLGTGQALDVTNDGVYSPEMAATGNYSGQFWKITPVTAGQWRVVSMFQPARSLAAGPDQPAVLRATDRSDSAEMWTIRKIP